MSSPPELPWPEAEEARIPLANATLTLRRDFLAPEAADEAFAALREGTRWAQETLRIAGRETPVPRLTAWHGDPGARYAYSGVLHRPDPWTPPLAALRDAVQGAAGAPFNSVLLNLYRDGRDSVAWHSDDEPELGEEPVIASLSLGATRVFQLKPRGGARQDRVELRLPHGSLLVMSGGCQRHWQHRVPKRPNQELGPRINLTFRYVRHPR